MKLYRRWLLGALVTLGAVGQLPRAWLKAASADGPPIDPIDGIFRPEDFGARGDGRTNDTRAFAELSAAVNRRGGGRIVLRPVTYVVGEQSRVPGTKQRFLFAPRSILHLTQCDRAISIEGNGATLRCAPGLRYGVFNPATDQAAHPPLPFYADGVSATPYDAMIVAERCRGAIRIANLTLDGRADGLVVGGKWGDVGWQLAGSGIRLTENLGDEVIEDVIARAHPLDGILIDGVSAPTRSVRRFTRVSADGNGRQGCSLVGGSGYRFEACKFERTGRGRISSAPGAGFDIEAEGGKRVSNLVFTDCRFSDNAGCGLLADAGPSSDAVFQRCTFIGTSAWAAWPAKPRFRFDRCSFVGAVANCLGGSVADATSFSDCTFRDDPSLAPRRAVFLGGGASGPIVDLSTTVNVRFSRCRFLLTGGGRLPWSTGAIYADCIMTQRDRTASYPRGTYLGKTAITGNAMLEQSRIRGQLTINGRAIAASR